MWLKVATRPNVRQNGISAGIDHPACLVCPTCISGLCSLWGLGPSKDGGDFNDYKTVAASTDDDDYSDS